MDSNLIGYNLPNGMEWRASYDSMKRKVSEELQAKKQTSLRWEYTYEKGYLKQAQDPMKRIHKYSYDAYGRLLEETVHGKRRSYTYDPRGLITSAEQSTKRDQSLVKRDYDSDGRLTLESIYLNDKLIQKTNQSWEGARRSLQIGDHTRDFTYQNRHLVQVSTANLDLSYTYARSGALKSKSTPLSKTLIDYNSSGLPEFIQTNLPDGSYQERLDWYPSGKLYSYSSPSQQKHFTYSERGFLETAGEESYDFDFGAAGIGIRTGALDSAVSQDGLDDFGKILTEVIDKKENQVTYDLMGQVASQGDKKLEWDPWGRLVKVATKTYVWEAFYDPFGRRLQTRYKPNNKSALVMTSLFDPEEEFGEIGVQYAGKTFWKIYGPTSCDAVTDAEGNCIFLQHNALDQLMGVVSKEGVFYSEEFLTSYGPQSASSSIPRDLLSYAKSLSWHSQAQDPTGLIWMGKRYYDPKGGRFLSPDPIGYPICLDLYVYANGDPVNYLDSDGRFSSSVYQAVQPSHFFGIAPYLFNSVTGFCGNHNFTRSRYYEIGSFPLTNGGIGFVNGINNNLHEAVKSAKQVSLYAGGAKVYGIHNATNSVGGLLFDPWGCAKILIDVMECLGGSLGFGTPTVQLVKNQWKQFFDTHGPDTKFLQFCHSGGGVKVKQALEGAPESIRQRIIVVAFAPSVIVPKNLCFESYNYISKRDFVTHLDILGKKKYGNELQVLEPHPNAPFWDHDFLSPTFNDVKQIHINDYIKNFR